MPRRNRACRNHCTPIKLVQYRPLHRRDAGGRRLNRAFAGQAQMTDNTKTLRLINPSIWTCSRNDSLAHGSGSGHPCPTTEFLRFLALLATLVAKLFAHCWYASMWYRCFLFTKFSRTYTARDSECRDFCQTADRKSYSCPEMLSPAVSGFAPSQ
jgi:hypothetical protein